MRQLCPQKEHLLTLMRLRLGLSYQDLANRFGVSRTLARRIFHSWFAAMAKTIRCSLKRKTFIQICQIHFKDYPISEVFLIVRKYLLIHQETHLIAVTPNLTTKHHLCQTLNINF